MSELALRKAALVASLMDRDQRKRLLASVPRGTARHLRLAIAHVERQGWARRDMVEQALGQPLTAIQGAPDFGLDELVKLAEHVDARTYARVLAAAPLRDHGFLFSLLPAGFAGGVQGYLEELPVMPERLRTATLAAARQQLQAVAA
ncbi:hypothetical protein IB223_14440 [Pseudoxanthomonas sp. PXM03]|uniref:hypothetical protein n=1 Tax=Pseudoxanthomonas sp. PXM03 TaxID=2769284 RepID=UPI001786AC44|nr:hypothetical protein [Pseudoxanthomonas sp. PXM03]MBD9437299.1 hypothetical protein [Pseudoxanthomonas sp. PXM03]